MNIAAKAISALVVLGTLTISGSVWAAAGSNAAAQSQQASGQISACGQTKQGSALIDCVGDALSSLSTSIDRGDVKKFAPVLISLTAQASEIRGKPKAQALQILNKVLSVTRSLAAKGAADLQPAYSAVAGAFARAISVVERKG